MTDFNEFRFGGAIIDDPRIRNMYNPRARRQMTPTFRGTNPIENAEAFAGNELIANQRSQINRITDSLERTEARTDEEADAARARGLASQASDVTEAQFRRRTEGLGLSERQRAGARQRLGLTRALSVADAGSASRRRTAESSRLSREALAGFEDTLFGQEASGLIGLANAEGQRRVREEQKRQQKKANKRSTLGTIIGVGASLLSVFSSEKLKDKVEKDPKLLDKLKHVRVDRWRYKNQDQAHIGPYAEEFNDTFEVGQDNRGMINVVDLMGVTVGGLKELSAKVEELDGKLSRI